jgi:polyisoprenoid-binding protein YceI
MFFGCYPIFIPSPILAGTGFNLSTNGAKKVSIDNKVNTNEVKFLSEAPLETIKGSASGIKGSFSFDPQNIEATQGEILIQVKTMNTGVALRDTHMSSEDWLDEAKYPSITFKIEKISDVKITSTDAGSGRGVAQGIAHGIFTLHGMSKAMSFPITLTFVKESTSTKQRAPGDFVFVQSKFTVNWTEFGVKGKGNKPGKVNENINIDVSLFGSNGL